MFIYTYIYVYVATYFHSGDTIHRLMPSFCTFFSLYAIIARFMARRVARERERTFRF